MENRLQMLYETITKRLIEKKVTISTMESCTGGLIASLLTDTEGASAVFPGSFITYSNVMKELAGVPKDTLSTYGVYSKETALAMAKTCQQQAKTDIGIGVTGSFQNTDPKNPDSRPGEVDFAIAFDNQEMVQHLSLPSFQTRRESKCYVAEEVGKCILALLHE